MAGIKQRFYHRPILYRPTFDRGACLLLLAAPQYRTPPLGLRGSGHQHRLFGNGIAEQTIHQHAL